MSFCVSNFFRIIDIIMTAEWYFHGNRYRWRLYLFVLTGIYCTEKESGHYINPKVRYFSTEHTDVVKAIGCVDLRVYSGG